MIIPRKNEDIESVIKRFKRYTESNYIIEDYRKKDYYEKPSVVKHRKKIMQQRRSK